MEDVSP